MQHITLEEVKSACVKAYDEKRLLFQHTVEYGYAVEGFRCAIGCALSDETLEEIETLRLQKVTIVGGENSETGTRLDQVISWDEDEERDLERIQRAHDELCGRLPNSDYYERLDYFLVFIGHPSRRDGV